MQRNIVNIKDMGRIEAELDQAPVGIAAFRSDDNIVQKTTTFVYQDKNIFILFSGNEEDFKRIKLERSSSFSILKNLDAPEGYRIMSITISGKIKLVDDPKVFEQIGRNYIKKYKLKKTDITPYTGSVIIDTEEIQAFEESGD